MDREKIGLFGAVSIGIGGMVGGGIFAVLGEAVSFAHGATWLAFLFAGIVAILTSYSYAKLSVTFQTRGGTVSYIDEAFGKNLLSGSINMLLWLSYLVTISLYAVAFASYAQTFFSHPTPLIKHSMITLAILLPTFINLVSASFVSKSETLIVFIKVVLLLVIISVGYFSIDVERLSPQKWGTPLSIVVAGMIIFVAYEGFELIANAAEDIKNPEKNLPKAFYISVSAVILLYVLISVITVGSVSEEKLLKAKDYALAFAAEPSLGHTGFVIVAVAALLATFSAINATIYGNARLGFIIAKEGELPKILEKEKRDVPSQGILIITFMSLLMANLIDLTRIAILGSAGFLFIFALVNLSAFKLYKKTGANRIVTLCAFAVSFLALSVLMFHTYQSDFGAVFVFVLFLLFSFLFEYLYGRLIRGHLFRREYQ